MANKNAVNFQQEMADRGTEQSNYSSLEQRHDEEGTYSEIQQSDRPQHSSDQLKEKNICNSKIQICLIVIGMVALVVASCILTAIILQQKIDSLSDEMKSMKMNISRDFVSVDQESNWLEWTQWSECSVSCSGGIQGRTRTCDGPDKGPHVCVGNDVDISACNNNTCVVPMVYFTITGSNSQLVSGKVIFSYSIANVGGGYNDQTGEFVCSVSGLYHFFFSFTQQSTESVWCWIYHNNFSLTAAYTSSDGTWDAASTSVYIQLAVGDVVFVGDCTNWQYANHIGYESVFTGSLIHL